MVYNQGRLVQPILYDRYIKTISRKQKFCKLNFLIYCQKIIITELGLLILFCFLRLLDYLALHSFDIERTLWMLYQKRAVRTKLYIYVCISISRIIYNQNESLVLHNSTIWWKTELKQREKQNYSIVGVNNPIVKKLQHYQSKQSNNKTTTALSE